MADEHRSEAAPPVGPPPLPADVSEHSEPASVEEIERALLHQTESTRTYPCRQCGGELEFAIDIQELRCPHCGNVQEIVDDDRMVVEQDFRAELAALNSGALASTGPQVEGE